MHRPSPTAVPARQPIDGRGLLRAERAVRGLDRLGPSVAGLAWPLLRAEAIAWCRTRGADVDNLRLGLATRPWAGPDPAAGVVLGQMAALARGRELARAHLTLAHLDDVHGLLRRPPQGDPGGPGAPGERDVSGLMRELMGFCLRSDLPGVAQAVIAFAEIRFIRPYLEGSEAIGRVLVQLLLLRRGLCRAAPLPLSVALAAAADRDTPALHAYGRGDPEPLLGVLGDAVCDAVAVTENLVADARAARDRWAEMAGRPRPGSAAALLVSALPSAALLDLDGARRVAGTGGAATLAGLRRLTAAGVLREGLDRGLQRVWECPEAFALLDALHGRPGVNTADSYLPLLQ